eukprot:m.105907 g.105907  ORF g.105907 m.105907 type:complete len:188 (+) comp15294_c0_seq13:625-1188(+)
MYLYFFEWDGFEDIPHVSVARATTASGGVPGSWWKWYNGSYSQPGLHGDSDMLTGMHDASSVRYRHQQQDYISVQQSGSTGLQVMHSTNGLDFEALPVVLVPTDYPNWTRASTSGELYAYVSPVGLGGTHDVQHDFSLYYTYLQVTHCHCLPASNHFCMCSFSLAKPLHSAIQHAEASLCPTPLARA